VTPLPALDVTIRAAQKPKKITLQPQGKNLPFTYRDGKAQVKVDPIEIYDILVVE